MAISGRYTYSKRATIGGSTVADGGTVVVVAAPAAGTTLVVGALSVSVEGGSHTVVVEESDGTEILRLVDNFSTTHSIPISQVAGIRMGAAEVGLGILNSTGSERNISAFVQYDLEDRS